MRSGELGSVACGAGAGAVGAGGDAGAGAGGGTTNVIVIAVSILAGLGVVGLLLMICGRSSGGGEDAEGKGKYSKNVEPLTDWVDLEAADGDNRYSKAATQIQARHRGKQARNELERRHTAAARIQAQYKAAPQGGAAAPAAPSPSAPGPQSCFAQLGSWCC